MSNGDETYSILEIELADDLTPEEQDEYAKMCIQTFRAHDALRAVAKRRDASARSGKAKRRPTKRAKWKTKVIDGIVTLIPRTTVPRR